METQETLPAAKPSQGRPEIPPEEQQQPQLSIPSEPHTAVMPDLSVISGITDAEEPNVVKTDEEQQQGLEDAEPKVPDQVILPPAEDSSNGPATAAEESTTVAAAMAAVESSNAAAMAVESTAAAMATDNDDKPQSEAAVEAPA